MTDFSLNALDPALSPTAQIEALQMTSEANSAAMIMFNARLAMLAEAVGVDISEPPLTEVEEKNKDMLLKSVGQRMMRLMQMTHDAMGGTEKLTGNDVSDAFQAMVKEVWPEGSISGDTRPVADPMPVIDPVDTPVPEWQKAVEERHPGSKVVQTDVPPNLTPEMDTALAKSIREAELVASSPEEATAVFESQHPDAVLKRQIMEAEAPLFRPAPDDGFTVGVLSADAFSGIDLTVQEKRQEIWDAIVAKYCADTDVAVTQNWISGAWAERLKQEFRLSPDSPEVTSVLTLPTPGDVANGVAQTAAAGDTMITITGITEQTEVVEALMTAFMTSAARMNFAISAALLPNRLAQMGMNPTE